MKEVLHVERRGEISIGVSAAPGDDHGNPNLLASPSSGSPPLPLGFQLSTRNTIRPPVTPVPSQLVFSHTVTFFFNKKPPLNQQEKLKDVVFSDLEEAQDLEYDFFVLEDLEFADDFAGVMLGNANKK
ncbi:hypothetical protein SOVF_154740 [Spinacia oleracea]|nr:hypothetical protein SOVF_154740 [Spinacia oleracea]